MLYVVQRFPDERHITVNNDTGCIIIILWAHYIANLTVSVVMDSGKEAKFGSATKPHLVISSQPRSYDPVQFIRSESFNVTEDPIVRLHEKDMSIVFECKPSKQRLRSGIENRHPIAGYGTEFLRRHLNLSFITPNDDQVYVEASLLVAAPAINITSKQYRACDIHRSEEFIKQHYRLKTEKWRILKAANLIFGQTESDSLDMRKIENFAKFFESTQLDDSTLPSTFDGFISKHDLKSDRFAVQECLIYPVQELTAVLIILSRIYDIESCATAPIILNPTQVFRRGRPGDEDEDEVWIKQQPHDAFHGLAHLLSNTADVINAVDDAALDGVRRPEQQLICLYSEMSWSVFLDTFTNRDPADTRSHLIHFCKGVSTVESTGEQRFYIRDGQKPMTATPGPIKRYCPLERGAFYTPRSAIASVNEWGDWVTRASEFEYISYTTMIPSAEWSKTLDLPGVKSFEETSGCRERHEALWSALITPSCRHSKLFGKNVPYPKD